MYITWTVLLVQKININYSLWYVSAKAAHCNVDDDCSRCKGGLLLPSDEIDINFLSSVQTERKQKAKVKISLTFAFILWSFSLVLWSFSLSLLLSLGVNRPLAWPLYIHAVVRQFPPVVYILHFWVEHSLLHYRKVFYLQISKYSLLISLFQFTSNYWNILIGKGTEPPC